MTCIASICYKITWLYINQSSFFKIITKTRDQVAIAFGLVSDWSITWYEFFKPIISQERKTNGNPDKMLPLLSFRSFEVSINT